MFILKLKKYIVFRKKQAQWLPDFYQAWCWGHAVIHENKKTLSKLADFKTIFYLSSPREFKQSFFL